MNTHNQDGDSQEKEERIDFNPFFFTREILVQKNQCHTNLILSYKSRNED